MNQTTRRNWLKSIAALAAGMLGLPLAAHRSSAQERFMSSKDIPRIRPGGTGSHSVTILKVQNVSGASLYPKRLVRWHKMFKVNKLDRSKTWRG